jgi:hypothetical protein
VVCEEACYTVLYMRWRQAEERDISIYNRILISPRTIGGWANLDQNTHVTLRSTRFPTLNAVTRYSGSTGTQDVRGSLPLDHACVVSVCK